VEVREFRPELWRWTAPHPDWTPEQGGPDGWEADIGCVYYEAPDAIVLIDPLVPAGEEERFWRSLERDVERAARPIAILLTIAWHVRSAAALAERFDARVYAHAPARGEVEKRGTKVTDPFELGDPLPGGVVAFDALGAGGELVFWLPEPAALVPGDVLIGNADGVRVCPDDWLPKGYSDEQLREDLSPLRELPVKLLLVSHGEPVVENAREALARALSPR
jgi:glyoxylase-like metal-dependent hydrolase (beta-lactamase superfamily II)